MKQSKIITHQPKSTESPNVVDIRSVTLENPRTSPNLSITIGQGEKILQVVFGEKISNHSFLYFDTRKYETFS